MILIVSALVFLIVGVAMIREFTDMFDGFVDWVMAIFMGVLIGGLAGSAVFGVGFGLSNWLLDHKDHYERVSLVAIKDGSSVAGTFVWGTGSVGPIGKYSFYYQDGAAKRLVSVDSANINLFEDSKDAYAVSYTGCDLSPVWVSPCATNGARFVEIHVPPGTVKAQTDLSLRD